MYNMRPGCFLSPFLLVAAWALFPPAAAAEGGEKDAATVQQLEEVERALDQSLKKTQRLKARASGIDDEMEGMSRQLVAAAAAAQDHEAEVSRLEARLAELSAEEDDKSARLKERRSQFTGVLMALERLARYPPEALIAQPLSPSQTVRSAILLRAVVPQIERRAGRLRTDLSALVHARREIGARRAELASASRGLQEQRARLDKLLAGKKALKARTLAETGKAERQAKDLALKAKSLRDLMMRLETERAERTKQAAKAAPASPVAKPAPPAQAAPAGNAGAMALARGKLPFPAVGRIVHHYGQTTDTGMTRKGITIETLSLAQVVAPYDGRVVFAGLFRGYGELLIIEHSEGYHSLLAGLSRIDSVIGQKVLGGEPVGIMGRSAKGPPALYVELRRNGRPINPLPWLAARKNKVSG